MGEILAENDIKTRLIYVTLSKESLRLLAVSGSELLSLVESFLQDCSLPATEFDKLRRPCFEEVFEVFLSLPGEL